MGITVTALLLSGGMDSVAIAAWKRPQIAFTVDYGQRAAKAEIAASRQVCSDLQINHEVIQADTSALGSGDMSETPALAGAPASDWWPFRNQLLVTLAGIQCVTIGVTELMIGSVASDEIHADGRTEFYEALNALLAVQEGGLQVNAPALRMTTVELVKASGIAPGVLAWAHSCHVGEVACGQCRGCVKHIEVTRELGGQAY